MSILSAPAQFLDSSGSRYPDRIRQLNKSWPVISNPSNQRRLHFVKATRVSKLSKNHSSSSCYKLGLQHGKSFVVWIGYNLLHLALCAITNCAVQTPSKNKYDEYGKTTIPWEIQKLKMNCCKMILGKIGSKSAFVEKDWGNSSSSIELINTRKLNNARRSERDPIFENCTCRQRKGFGFAAAAVHPKLRYIMASFYLQYGFPPNKTH